MMQSMSSSNRRESIRQTSSPALMRLSPQWKNILKQKCLDRARQKRSNRIISNRRRGQSQSQSNSNSHSGSTSMSTSMSMTMTMDTGSTSVPLSPSLLPPIYPSLQTDKKSCNYIPNSSFPSESKNVARELVQEQLNATGVAIIPANSLLLAQSSSQFKTGNAMNMQPFQYREKTSTTKGATFVNPYLSNSHDAKVLQSQSQLQLQPQSHPSEHSIPSIQQQASGQDVDFITEEELNQLLWEVEQELDNEEEAFIAEEMRVIQEEEMREKRMMEEQILAFEEYMDHNTDNHNMSTDMMQ